MEFKKRVTVKKRIGQDMAHVIYNYIVAHTGVRSL